MNIQRISHIGIAVRDLDQQIPLYRDILGLPFLGVEEVEDQAVRVALFGAGEVRVELLEPKSAQSPIAKFLNKHGEGIHGDLSVDGGP